MKDIVFMLLDNVVVNVFVSNVVKIKVILIFQNVSILEHFSKELLLYNYHTHS